MSWMTSLLNQAGQGGGQFLKGFAGGVGEGAGIPQLAGKFTRAQGVSGLWADVGRSLGEQQGKQVGVPASTMSALAELAGRPSTKAPIDQKKKKKMIGDFIIPSESSYIAGE